MAYAASPMGAPAMQIVKRIETEGVHGTMITKVFGQEDVLMHQRLSDSARCLGFSISALSNPLNWSWDWCFWGELIRPRSYVKVTENAMEFNYPNMPFCPLASCVKDNVTKVYFDKMLTTEPYVAKACTPYHFCCCVALCGEVFVVAPHDQCANCCCLNMFPCFFKMYPGLENAQALVDFVKASRSQFIARKGLSGGAGVAVAQAVAGTD